MVRIAQRPPYRRVTVLAALVALAASGCVKDYRPPKEGEAAALVKVKMGYGDAKARGLLPAGSMNDSLSTALFLHEGGERYLVYSQTYDEAFDLAEPVLVETHGTRVRPGQPLTFELRLGVFWQTQEWEWVTRHHRIPVQRQVTRRVYDPRTKSYTVETTTVTDWVTESRLERELITRDHERACTAAVTFVPDKDGVYLLDYENPEIVADCAVLAYRQTAKEDGGFQLEPVVTGYVQ